MSNHLIRPLLLILFAMAAPGCGWTSKLAGTKSPFDKNAPCALPPEATKDEVIAYLNKNVLGDGDRPGLTSWSSSIKVTATGMAGIETKGEIAVAAPRNLRLNVFQPVSKNLVMDLGSNDEQFWLWSQEEKQQVMTCRHDDFAMALTELNMPLPFHPDWMMEVFGVIPLDPSEFRMERPFSGSPIADLIADRYGPSGEPVQRVIRIDSCHGYVMEHQLRRNDGSTIARAILYNHYRDPATQLTIAKKVRIDWPDIDGFIVLTFSDINVNPTVSDDSPKWTMPSPPGSQVVDLGDLARSRRRPNTKAVAEGGAIPPDNQQASATSDGPDAPVWPASAATTPPTPEVQLSIEPEDWQRPDERAGRIGPEDMEFEQPEPAGESSAPTWAQEPTIRMQSPHAQNAQQQSKGFSLFNWLRATRPSAGGPPSAYSSEASRSSSVRPRLGLE